jgi:hypothetical protein
MARRFLISVALLTGSCLTSAYAAVDRPQQFVMMAFDNCTELERWVEWTNFIKQNPQVRFTFFVSGVNFLADDKAKLYQGPKHNPGQSNIDFGGSPEDVEKRVGYINALYNKGQGGNDFGSHTVGHFDGGEDNWSAADWAAEFKSYGDLLDNIAKNNGLASTVKLDYRDSDIKGFRAPYLSTNSGLDPTLQADKFRYDTSLTGEITDWPAKDKGGVWHFNLVSLTVPGHKQRPLSMDYNFYAVQSPIEHGEPVDADPKDWPRLRQEMFDAYLAYFKTNYEGNRAPLHIGHHFFDYQGGIYKQALMAFAKVVCTVPEVQCVAYSKLADFLDAHDAATLKAYQNGDFDKIKLPPLDTSGAFSTAQPLVAVQSTGGSTLQASLVGDDQTKFAASTFASTQSATTVTPTVTPNGAQALIQPPPAPPPPPSAPGEPVEAIKRAVTLVLRDATGQEVWRNTFHVIDSGGTTTIVKPHPELKLKDR